MGETVGIADDKVIEGIARHLGRKSAALFLDGNFAQFVLRDHQHVEIRGKEIGKSSADPVAEAGLQDGLLEFVVGAEDKFIKMFDEGDTITIPHNFTETADMTQELLVEKTYGVEVIMASKVGVYTIS